ncbi:hypothetical protein [uncultured Polaribacter sp.]|uniref:hypothetical protein n=1 Tax=uncultured Polaribacter sp. TaxID=174711 RepID=UPI0032B0F23F
METNKIDTNIKQKFAQRELAPSASAWERLSKELDGQPKHKKRGWFLYTGYAATVLILISVGIYTFSRNAIADEILENVLVKQEIDTVQILHKIDKVFNEVPLEKAIVKAVIVKEKQLKTSILEKSSVEQSIAEIEADKILKKEADTPVVTKEIRSVVIVEEKKAIVIPIKETIINKTTTQPILKARIKVNAEELLYAVTNESKYPFTISFERNTNRAELLATIKNELEKSNFQVDPKIILAEVELAIKDDFFDNNFLETIRKSIESFATAAVNRNN